MEEFGQSEKWGKPMKYVKQNNAVLSFVLKAHSGWSIENDWETG